MSVISSERVFEVLRSPIISEKSTFVSQYNHYVFRVALDSNKQEIKCAVEKIFNVKVTAVNTLVQNGKIKRFRENLVKE